MKIKDHGTRSTAIAFRVGYLFREKDPEPVICRRCQTIVQRNHLNDCDDPAIAEMIPADLQRSFTVESEKMGRLKRLRNFNVLDHLLNKQEYEIFIKIVNYLELGRTGRADEGQPVGPPDA